MVGLAAGQQTSWQGRWRMIWRTILRTTWQMICRILENSSMALLVGVPGVVLCWRTRTRNDGRLGPAVQCVETRLRQS